MVRPRFQKLPAEQRDGLLRAAASEFAAHGFAEASLNRVIEAAGISKGSFYYYFDDKADLYAHVVREELRGLLERAGPFGLPEAVDADGFWTELAGHYLRTMAALQSSPELAALIRGWVSTAGVPGLQQAQRELEEAAMPWFLWLLRTGQEVGAVRTDLPEDLLLAVVFGMGQAMDLWLIGAGIGDPDRPGAPTVQDVTPILIGMIRRACQP